VQGVGPVGLAACVAALDARARAVVATGDPPVRLAVARRLGTVETMGLAVDVRERRSRVLDLTDGRGADVVIEAAGHIGAFDEGLWLLAVGGRYLLLGLYSGSRTVPFNPVTLNNRQLTLLGSLGGPLSADHRAVDIAIRLGRTHDFDALVSETFLLEQTELAIERA
jgi:threonine dehydrogenase-like Zn-dependent dehydrogenase